MYHGTYGDAGIAITDLPSIILDVKMFVLADKYFIEPFKAVACAKFAEHCESKWKTGDFARAVQELYESGVEDRGLKDVAVTCVRAHAKEMLVKKDDYPDISRAMRETPDFGADGITELATASHYFTTTIDRKADDSPVLETAYRWTFACPKCSSTFSLDIPVGDSFTFNCPQGHHQKSFAEWVRYKI
jgi:hypothetical protein